MMLEGYIRFKDWVISVIIVMLCCIGALFYLNHALTETYQDHIDRFQMYNSLDYVDMDLDKELKGVYWPSNDYYCVWVRDREISDIDKTDRHEYCHHLIDNDYDHFCQPDRTTKNR